MNPNYLNGPVKPEDVRALADLGIPCGVDPTTGEWYPLALNKAVVPMKVKRVHPDAIIPQYQKDGDACFDLHCISGALLGPHENWALEAKGQAVEFRTGLAFEVPPGYGMFIFSRSGHGFNHGVRLSNCVGVIDSGYRGEVKVKLHLDVQFHWKEGRHYGVMAGDRIAQAMLLPIPMVRFVEVDELSDSERGAGGFGSTGAAA